MARRVITPETYSKLVEAYKVAPGNHTHAAREVGCGVKFARRAYNDGWPGQEWAKPIRLVVREQQVAARAAMRVAAEERALKEEEARKLAHEEAVITRAQEGQLTKLVRLNAVQLLAKTADALAACTPLIERVKRVARQVEQDMQNGLEPKVSADEAVEMVRKVSVTTKNAAALADAALRLERVRLGAPEGPALGLTDDDDLTDDEAIAELDAAARARDRATRLRVVRGGDE